MELPFRTLPTKNLVRMQRIHAAIAVVIRYPGFLVCQRKDDNVLGGYWEFPGGKCEGGESLCDCLSRELREELNISARVITALTPIDHDYPHGNVRLHPFICQHESGEPQLLECQAVQWVQPQTLAMYRFPPANESLIEEVIRTLANSDHSGLPRVDFRAKRA